MSRSKSRTRFLGLVLAGALLAGGCGKSGEESPAAVQSHLASPVYSSAVPDLPYYSPTTPLYSPSPSPDLFPTVTVKPTPTPTPTPMPPPTPLRWSINLHAADVAYDAAQARTAFQHIRALGATMVRTDFDWNKLEPAPGTWDDGYQQFFDNYLNDARAQGLEVICVLAQPPDWALAQYRKGDIAGFLAAFKQYAEHVATRYGDRLYYYQYWDEANRDTSDPINRDHDWRLFLSGDQGVRAGDHNGHVGMVNFSTNLANAANWAGDATYYFQRMKDADPAHTVRLIGIDHFPGTWAQAGDWQPLQQLMNAVTDATSPCYGFDLAVMETGYSTYLPWKSESVQADWYRSNLATLRQQLTAFNYSHASRFRFVNLYELYDVKAAPLNAEANFGLYRTDGQPKQAVDALRQALAH